MATKDERLRLIDRVMHATADHLGRGLSEKDEDAIRRQFSSTPGRPRRSGWNVENRRLLERMVELRLTGKEKNKTEAARVLSKESPEAAQSSIYHWLRRNYREYLAEKKEECLKNLLNDPTEEQKRAVSALLQLD